MRPRSAHSSTSTYHIQNTISCVWDTFLCPGHKKLLNAKNGSQTRAWVQEVEQGKRQHLEGLLSDAIDAGLSAECRHSIRLAPLVVDSYGCWGPATEKLLQECASRRPAPQRSAALRRWRAALNIAVFRENSRLLRVRAGKALGPGVAGLEPPPNYWREEADFIAFLA